MAAPGLLAIKRSKGSAKESRLFQSHFSPFAHNALHRVCGTPAFNSLAIHAVVIVVLRLKKVQDRSNGKEYFAFIFSPKLWPAPRKKKKQGDKR